MIALLLLAAVASAVTMASVGGSKVRGAAKLQVAMSKAGQQAQEDLATDRTWMSTCAATCNVAASITASSLVLDDVDGDALVVEAEAEPVDSPADRIGPVDEDGVTPDYYRIRVILEPDASVVARYDVPAANARRTFVTSIDRRGVMQVGSLSVQACRVLNQSDERMSIQGCAPSGPSYLRMNGCPASPVCGQAFQWVSSRPEHTSQPSPFVAMERVAPGSYASFSLLNLSTNAVTPASAAKQVDGEYVFQNLDAGEYRLVGLPASVGGAERWKSKEIPAYHGAVGDASAGASIAVEPGLRNRALVLFRPAPTGSGIRLTFDRRTTTRTIGGTFPTVETVVAPWAPTDSYEGTNGPAYCAAFMDELMQECYVTPGISPNCISLLTVHGEDQIPRPDAYCTYYSEYMTHHYYRVVNTTSMIRPGAAATAVYEVEPRPDVRVADNLVIPIDTCSVQERSPTCSPAIDDLRAGLNSAVMVPADGLSGGSNVANATRNQAVSGTPAWMTDGALWVRTNGAILSSSGTDVGANPPVTLTGIGECYWRSPNYDGEREGSCNPCTPSFTTAGALTKACTILVRTCWTREAIERNYMGEAFPLPTQGSCFSYGVPWKCTGVPVILGGGNCTPPSPPPTVPQTFHTSPATGGTGRVRARVVTAMPGGA